MTIEPALMGEDALPGRVQTPDNEDATIANQKRLPGVSRPASRTPIGSPAPERQTETEMSHANSWSLCDLFGGQERPNSTSLEQRQFSVKPPPAGSDSSPKRTAAVGSLTPASPAPAGTASPELPTYHPQPTRLHQSVVMPLLESEASLPPLDEPEGDEKAMQSEQMAASVLADHTASDPNTLESKDGIDRRGFVSTPSPDRECLEAVEQGWLDSPKPGMTHGSVQNTPEPSHYHGSAYHGTHMGVMLPIRTPSPRAITEGSACNGQPPYLGVPPRFPNPISESGAAATGPAPPVPLGGMHGHGSLVLPSQMSGGYSSTSTMIPPPLPSPQSGVVPQSDAVAHLPPQTVAFGGPFPMTLSSLNAGMLAQGARAHVHAHMPGHMHSQLVGQGPGHLHSHMHGQMQGQLQSLQAHVHGQLHNTVQGQMPTHMHGHLANHLHGHVQNQLAAEVHNQMQTHMQNLGHNHAPNFHNINAANPQDPHHIPQGFQHMYQQAGAVRPVGGATWPLPGCAMPMGFPQALPQCVEAPVPVAQSCSGPQAGSTTPAVQRSDHGQSSAEPAAQTIKSDEGAHEPSASAQGAQSNTSQNSSTCVGAGDAATASSSSEVAEMRGQVMQLSKTQAGSKYLQRQLLKGQTQVVDVILQEVEQDIAQLMCDPYGNYLCSVAFQACSMRQRKRMLEKLAPKIAAIACDKRGTHALQALIGLLSTADEQDLLMHAIKSHLIELCMDPNGTHVVQRLLFCFMPPCIDWIYCLVVKHLVEVAHHPYGLCVLKKCISQAKGSAKHQELLLAQLAQNALDLVQSPYGNYAVQHALEEWGGNSCTPIFRSLEGRMMQLSIQKFSSNVVEKIFCAAPQECRARLISELIESDKMSVLVNSNYGHYVAKRALQLADPQQVRKLLDAIRENIQQLPNRRLRAKWEKVMTAGNERLNGR